MSFEKHKSMDLLKLCSCGLCSISEHDRRCWRCEEFATRRRDITDADVEAAIRDGLIQLPKPPTERTP